MTPFTTVLVANRGEIACRVIRTAARLGYRTVAVYSDADRDAPHVAMADRAVHIGPSPARESYLDVARLLDAAERTGADTIHPGYGFLSENADFARAVLAAGLVWIGPPPDAIEAMGDKARSKQHMRAAGVPCVPGFDADDPSDEALVVAADGVGYPLLVKASAGGGGRGMRRVYGPDALLDAIRGARAEAASAFGSDRLLLERLLTEGRHVEVQVFADVHGNVVHLGERDCSVQRRHQKIIEESPSPAVDADLRDRMGAAACAAARAVGYVGAGTVEFMLERGEFYFLEMNTRLQVEHPVTEAITGLDLVEWQLRVASGERLPLEQAAIQFSGHAIEARLYAEDPAADFAPQTGDVAFFRPSPSVRTDAGVGPNVSPFYDPMVAKLVAHGRDREEARRKLLRGLDETLLLGLRTNQAFLGRVLAHPAFAAGEATTTFLETNDLRQDPPVDLETLAIAAALAAPSGFRNAHATPQPVTLSVDGVRLDARVSPGVVTLLTPHRVDIRGPVGLDMRVNVDGIDRTVHVVDADARWIRHGRDTVRVTPWDPTPAPTVAAGNAETRAPSAGRVLWLAEVDSVVAVGDRVAVIEAMKLETTLRATVAGVVREVRATVGTNVSAGRVLVVLHEVS